MTASDVYFYRDVAPQGGYEPIRYKRNLPARGPGGLAIFGGVIAVCAYGFWRLGQGNYEQRYVVVLHTFLLLRKKPSSELKREKAWSRIHLVPLLLAESDRDTYRREQAMLAREKEIMKDVPNWKVSLATPVVGMPHFSPQPGQSVYNTQRYTPQNFVVL